MHHPSRHTVLVSLLGLPIAAGLAAAPAAAESGAAKVSKKDAHYQPYPQKNNMHGEWACGQCRHYRWGGDAGAPDTCEVVEGTITADGFCDYFITNSRC